MRDTDPSESLGPLSTVMLDRARLLLPVGWETGTDPGPLRWAAAPDRRFALERRTRWTPLRGAGWDGAVRVRAAAFLKDKGGDELIETIRTAPTTPVFNLRFLAKASDRPGHAAWHWLTLCRQQGGMTEAVYTLYIAAGEREGPRALALMAVLTEALAETPPHAPADIGSLEAGFGLDRLRPMTAFDRYRLHVPERWYDEYRPCSGQWAAGEEEPGTGMLFLGDRAFVLEDSGEARAVWQEALDPSWRRSTRTSDATRWIETNRPDRRAFYTCTRIEGDKERAFKHRWVLAQHHRNLLLIVNVVLLIGERQMAAQEFRQLVAHLQDEVVNCAIDGLDELIEQREAPSPWRGRGVWRQE